MKVKTIIYLDKMLGIRLSKIQLIRLRLFSGVGYKIKKLWLYCRIWIKTKRCLNNENKTYW